MTTALNSLFPEDRVDELRALGLETHGFDCTAVYCLWTGKAIGRFSDDEILEAIYEEGSDDPESILDGLMVRAIASMRPSPSMNKPDRTTLREMATRRPVDCLAFLVNRLEGHRNLLTKREAGAFSPLVDRIATHRRLTHLAAQDVDLSSWTHWLLELDAKMNLHDIHPPRVNLDKSNKLVASVDGTSLFQMLTAENASTLLAWFESWVFDKLEIYDKRDAQLLKESQWVRGNQMAGPAFAQSWLSRPEIANKKLQAAFDMKAKQAAKAGRPVTNPKTVTRNSKVNQFLGLLESIMDGDDTAPVLVATPATPQKSRIVTAGMLFAKKESV